MVPDPIPFALPDITEAEIQAVVSTLKSGWVTSGPEMAAFEAEFAAHVGGGVEAVAVNSGTAGLHLALEACGVDEGDEVIVPTWTFTATAEVVRYLGAKPVLVDIDPETLLLDLQRVADAVTPATKAVIPVHVAGLGVDVAALRDLIGPRIRVIEDAAHALPTVTNGSMVGSCDVSDAAVFSFYATKTITTGEGGMITTRDRDIARRARMMRLHGIDRDAFDRYRSDKVAWSYDVVAAGFKYNMTDPAASMGRVQLRRSSSMHARRSDLAERYIEAFRGLPVQLPPQPPVGDTHSWHLFILRVCDQAAIDRDGFIATLSERGVGTSVHFIPLHRHTVWRDLLDLQDHNFPEANAQFKRAVSLPIFSAMSDEQVERVTSTVVAALR